MCSPIPTQTHTPVTPPFLPPQSGQFLWRTNPDDSHMAVQIYTYSLRIIWISINLLSFCYLLCIFLFDSFTFCRQLLFVLFTVCSFIYSLDTRQVPSFVSELLLERKDKRNAIVLRSWDTGVCSRNTLLSGMQTRL